MKKEFIALIVALVLIVAALVPASAQGTTPNAAYIQYVETAEEGNGLKLGVYFTVVDEAGQVVPVASVRSAEVVLVDSGTYPAQVTQPEASYFITFVLDTSGSMQNALFEMRNAAIAALNSAPSGARFSLIRFENTIMPLIDAFTSSKNSVTNAIVSNIQSNGGGTCLYDAAYTAIEALKQAAPDPGQRRAIILFTDGKDELHIDQGDTCSTHTYDDVIRSASVPGKQVTIHTIGMSGQQSNINRDELARMANQTGGFPVVGTQAELSARFEQIMAGLSSQWLASAVLHPSQGTHDAILRVTLADGTELEPDVARFAAARSYVLTPTPAPTGVTPTATPLPPTIEIVGIQTDVGEKEVSFELEVENGGRIREYLFRFQNEDTGQEQQQEVRVAPVSGRLTFNTRDWPSGTYSIRVTASSANGTRLAAAESDRFRYTLPTPTPTITPTATFTPTRTLTPTASYTPIPCGATYNASQYDGETLIVYLNVQCASGLLSALVVQLFDGNDQLVGTPYRKSVEDVEDGVLEISNPNLQAGQQYCVVITSKDSADETLRDASGNGIVSSGCIRLPTATPTATYTETPTNTPTATPIVVSISIDQPPYREDEAIVFPIRTENEDLVKTYEVVFINDNGIASASISYAAPQSEIRVPLDQVEGGRYTVEFRALDAAGNQLTYALLPGTIIIPTPVPPTATPEPGLGEIFTNNAGIVIPVIVVFIIALIVVLVILLRKPEGAVTGTGFLEELTGIQEAKDLPPDYVPPVPVGDMGSGDETNYILQSDPDATNFDLQIPLPDAQLTVEKSMDKDMVGQVFTIDQVPFTIGRKDSNMFSFRGDNNVSGEHAVITFVDNVFYITDLNSRHGTVIDSQKLTPQIPTPLTSGCRIRIAETTILDFAMQAGYDSDATQGFGE